MNTTVIPSLVVAVIHRIGNDLDCLETVVGLDEANCREAIVEMLTDEANDWNAECAEYGDEPVTLPTWDGTDEDWFRLCQEREMVVFFHSHVANPA